MSNVTAEVLSPTSVRVLWLPPSVDAWNGVITRYTVQYSILRRVSAQEELPEDLSATLVTHLAPSQLRNNPNPTMASSSLAWEEMELDGLQAYFVYSFTVSYENSAGQSASSDTVELSLPYSGELKDELLQQHLTFQLP